MGNPQKHLLIGLMKEIRTLKKTPFKNLFKPIPTSSIIIIKFICNIEKIICIRI
jgi:hypothetical protein